MGKYKLSLAHRHFWIGSDVSLTGPSYSFESAILLRRRSFTLEFCIGLPVYCRFWSLASSNSLADRIVAETGTLKISCLVTIWITSSTLLGRFGSSSATRMLTETCFSIPGAIIPYSNYFTTIRLSFSGLMVILCAIESSFFRVIKISLIVPVRTDPKTTALGITLIDRLSVSCRTPVTILLA